MISPRRLRALIRKEVLQVGRDPSSILIAFVLPLLLLFIFGYGVSLDSEHVPVGLVLTEPGPDARSFAATLAATRYLDVTQAATVAELKPALVAGQLNGIVVLREDFSRNLVQPGGEAQIQVITDGSQPQVASFVENYVRGTFQTWQELQAAEQGGVGLSSPIRLESRVWYNPSLSSRYTLIPGAIAIILTVVGALLTALVIAREWERGTMEALLASPVTRAELLLGKFLPYFGLGLASFTICLLAAVLLFGVPFRGHLLVLYGITGLFLACALGMGLAISAAAKNQFLASQIAINAAFLPSFLLSGFIFEIRSMPGWIQAITHLVPARYYVTCLHVEFLSGEVWAILIPNALALLLAAMFFGLLVVRNLPRRLD